jgi:tetratricopeptide (TPR) repeat protein
LIQDCEKGKWCTQRGITTLDLPDNLSRLLQARIDRLTLDERHVLQIAAVIGQTFWLNLLQALVSEAISLKECLTALQRAQLIVERTRVPDLGMEYSFKSSLVRDAAYESLLSAQRAIYHLNVAIFFEENVEFDSRKQYEALIAYHYRRAGNPNKELFYTLRAAELASEVYANTEALGHYTRALDLLDEMQATETDENQRYAILTQRFEVLEGRLGLQYLLGNVEEGNADARALLPLAQEMSDDRAWLIDALLNQPPVSYTNNRDQIQEGLRMAHEALGLSQQLNDRIREMKSLIAITDLYRLSRDYRWHESAEQALALSRELRDARTEVNLLLSIGNAYGMDDLERSAEYLEAALPITQKLEDKPTEIRLLKALGEQCEREGDYYRLLTEYEQKRLQIAREIGDRITEGFALMYISQAQGIYLGDFEGALPIAQESLRITGGLTSRLYPLLRMAQIQIMMGRYEDAQESLNVARPIGDVEVDEIGRAGIALVSTILYNILGDEASLRKALEQCGWVFRMVDERLISRQYQLAAFCESSAAHLGLAELVGDESGRQHHLEQALESARKALSIVQEFGFVQVIECSLEEIYYRHSRALTANGYASEAREYFERAYREMMRKYELIPVDSQYRRTYLENIALHREIRSVYQSILLSGEWP